MRVQSVGLSQIDINIAQIFRTGCPNIKAELNNDLFLIEIINLSNNFVSCIYVFNDFKIPKLSRNIILLLNSYFVMLFRFILISRKQNCLHMYICM